MLYTGHEITTAKKELDFRFKKKRMIYSLRRKSSNEIFYVGVTAYPLARFYQHKIRFGSDTIMEELDIIYRNHWQGTSCKEEKYWINQLTAWGFNLVNVRLKNA